MALLVGTHLNRIDRKGRVSVPKPFRDALRGLGFKGIYAFPLPKFAAIEACGEDFMTRISDSIEDYPMFSDEQDDLSVILETSHALSFDPEGRVVLPAELVEHADLEGQILFVGRGRRMQLWRPETYEANRTRALERVRDRGITLPLRPSLRGGETKA